MNLKKKQTHTHAHAYIYMKIIPSRLSTAFYIASRLASNIYFTEYNMSQCVGMYLCKICTLYRLGGCSWKVGKRSSHSINNSTVCRTDQYTYTRGRMVGRDLYNIYVCVYIYIKPSNKVQYVFQSKIVLWKNNKHDRMNSRWKPEPCRRELQQVTTMAAVSL